MVSNRRFRAQYAMVEPFSNRKRKDYPGQATIIFYMNDGNDASGTLSITWRRKLIAQWLASTRRDLRHGYDGIRRGLAKICLAVTTQE